MPTARGIAVAHDGRLELFDEAGRAIWSAQGVGHATAMAASAERVAVIDALTNEIVIAELSSGRITRSATAETPIDVRFAGGDVYVLARDAAVVQRVGGGNINVGRDPAFLRESRGRLYVYSRGDGTLEEIENGRVVRRVRVAPFASDLELDQRTAYLVYPREGRIGTVALDTLEVGSVDVGAVPSDLALAGGGTALTARVLAVADPAAKRVWITEGTQSMTQAVARGFLRGFLGLGLFGNRSSQFPTGVDRVVARGSQWIAYDSSSGALYRVTRQKSTLIAKDVAPAAFAIAEDGIVWWDGNRVHRIR
jgi:hypothetical protein